MKKTPRLILGAVVIGGAFLTLVANSMKSNTLRAVPAGQLCGADNTPRSFVGQRVRMVGHVDHGALQKHAATSPDGQITINTFHVVDAGRRVRVEYRDALPDTFRAGSPVQVDGTYVAPGQMQADHVLTKCPSKYEAPAAKSVQGSKSKVQSPASIRS